MEKECQACHVPKPLEEFRKHRNTPDGHTHICLECLRAQRGPLLDLTPDEKRKRRLAKIRQRHASDPEYRKRHRGHQIKTAYGLLPEQYQALVDRQDGLCAICHQPPSDDRALHIDHNHETGAIRGLLCFSCNASLGHFGDDPTRLRAAAHYLETCVPIVVERDVRQRARAQCGTMSGYSRHAALGEPRCESCLRAKREYDRKMRAERATGRERKRRVEAVCGTTSGYVRHYKLGEKPCEACKAAMSEYHINRRASR
jgi:hypothetical protein